MASMARNDISSLFGKSPIKPLQKHMRQVHSCLKDFGVFAKAVNAQDWDEATTLAVSIRYSENSTSSEKPLFSMAVLTSGNK